MDEQTVEKLSERGVQAGIAKHFEITPQAVNLWIQNRKIPAERVVGVETVTGIPRAQLRPDLFQAA